MITITKIKQTCSACPSQWEAETEDNRAVYIRYRWGYLSIDISIVGANISYALSSNGTRIFGKIIGEEYDGVLSFDRLKELTKEVINWRETE